MTDRKAGTTVLLTVVQPFPWEALLAYLAPRCIPGAESVEQGAYIRRDPGGPGDPGSHCRVDYANGGLRLEVQAGHDAALSTAAVTRLFRPALDTTPIDAALAREPMLAESIARNPGLRLPGSWNGFELAVRVIIGQQVTVAAARTLLTRLVERCNGTLTPASCLRANTENLGMPQRRVETVLRVAELANTIDFDAVAWPTLRPQLAALKGIGPWTLGYLDMRLGLEPDVFPAGDVGLQIACGQRDARQLAREAEHWAPYRSFAALHLWNQL